MRIVNKLREPMNGFTHFIGLLLSIAATILLIINSRDALQLFSLSIFGSGLILLYTISTLYHWLNLSDKGVKRLRKADHIMIFINIAATYTPVCLLALKGTFGNRLLAGVWLVALAGIIIKLFWMGAPRWLSTLIYLLMGWLAVFVIIPMIHILPTGAIVWLFIGGLWFTIGAIICAKKKPDPLPGIFGFHEIFHVFVLLGSLSHFIMIYKYIAEF